MRKLFATAAAPLALLAGPALAQLAPGPLPGVVSPTGPVTAQPVVNIGYDSGTRLPCIVGLTATCSLSGGGGGGGSASYTATSSGSLAVTAGVNKPAVLDLFSHQGVLTYDNLGNYIDLTAPAKLVCQDGSSLMSTSCPLAVQEVAQLLTLKLGGVALYDAGGTTQATIKAASTGPSTTDSAIVVTQSPNPGSSVCPLTITINQTTGTDLHTFTNTGYLCTIYISNATPTQGWTLAEGTGTVCATGIAFDIGGAGGTTQGSVAMTNSRTTIKMQSSGKHLCLLQNGSTNISGVITYADAP